MPRLWQIIEQLATSQMSSQMPVRIACRTNGSTSDVPDVQRAGTSQVSMNRTRNVGFRRSESVISFHIRRSFRSVRVRVIDIGYRISYRIESGSCTAELGQFPNCKRMFPNQEVVKLTEHAHSRDQHTWIQCLHKLQMHLLLQLKSTAGPTPAHSTASRTH